jgi:COP9 signalosome complex subunit 6
LDSGGRYGEVYGSSSDILLHCSPVKETHPAADLLGWFTTTESLQFTPTPSHIQFHQKLLLYNESLIFLMINPSPIATLGGCGKLPVVIYESVYENDESENAINLLRLKFVPLKYTIESGEAEMIGMDFIAKGAGNATAKTSKAEESKGASAGTAPPQNVPAPGNDNGETKPGTESKGKDKENETSTAGKEESSSKSSAGTQNDELLSNLTSKKNAIVMLNTRIKLLLRYLKNPPDGRPNHQILREIQSLTNSRLPLLRPADIKAFEQEKMAEACDVNLVVLLGVMTKSIEDVRKAGRKFSGVEVILKTAGKGTTSNFEDTIEVFVGGGNGTGGSGTGGGGGGGGGMGSLGGGPVRERRSARGITGGGGVGGGSGGGSDGAFSGIFGL